MLSVPVFPSPSRMTSLVAPDPPVKNGSMIRPVPVPPVVATPPEPPSEAEYSPGVSTVSSVTTPELTAVTSNVASVTAVMSGSPEESSVMVSPRV